MIEHIKADIFTVKCDAIIHQANCFHTMGSGIARTIRELFPEAYAADCQTIKGSPEKMGKFSVAQVKNPDYPNIGHIVNLYSQFNFGKEERHTRYDALHDGLLDLRERTRKKAQGALRTFAIPHRIGCNRGGGDWNVVEAIIKSVFGNESDFKVLICEPVQAEPIVNVNSK